MCVHREHRTGNCGACGPQVAGIGGKRAGFMPGSPVMASSGMLETMDDPYRSRYVDMPDRWDGDDS